MKYRVVLEVGYNVAWFEFTSMEAAGEFAKTILMHQVESEDTRKKSKVRIDVVDLNAEKGEDDDE